MSELEKSLTEEELADVERVVGRAEKVAIVVALLAAAGMALLDGVEWRLALTLGSLVGLVAGLIVVALTPASSGSK